MLEAAAFPRQGLGSSQDLDRTLEPAFLRLPSLHSHGCMTLTDRRPAVTTIPSLADLDGGVEHDCCTALGRDDLLPGSIGQMGRYAGDSAPRGGQAVALQRARSPGPRQPARCRGIGAMPPDLRGVPSAASARASKQVVPTAARHRRCTPHVRRTCAARSCGYSAALVFFRPIRFHSGPNRPRFRARNAPFPLLPADLA
jgi:hypothetical protein